MAVLVGNRPALDSGNFYFSMFDRLWKTLEPASKVCGRLGWCVEFAEKALYMLGVSQNRSHLFKLNSANNNSTIVARVHLHRDAVPSQPAPMLAPSGRYV